MSKNGNKFTNFVSNMPFIGDLLSVPKYQIKQAFWETLTTLIFTTFPLWYLLIFGQKSIGEMLNSGEMIVFSAVLLGPLIYVITKKYGRFNIAYRSRDENGEVRKAKFPFELSMNFPNGGGFIVICVFVCFLAADSLSKLHEQDISTNASTPNLGLLSAISFMISVIVYFLVCSYRNMLDERLNTAGKEITDSQRKDDDNFSDKWQRDKQ